MSTRRLRDSWALAIGAVLIVLAIVIPLTGLIEVPPYSPGGWLNPVTSSPWTDVVRVILVFVAVALAVLLSQRHLYVFIPAIATIPWALYLGPLLLRAQTFNDGGDAYFHLKQTLRWTSFPLFWQANAFTEGYGTTYPWYWHAVNALPLRVLAAGGIQPEKAFVITVVMWAVMVPLGMYVITRLVAGPRIAGFTSAATLILTGTIDAYKLWSFIILFAAVAIAYRAWRRPVLDGRAITLSILSGFGVGLLFGWYTATSLAAIFALLWMFLTGRHLRRQPKIAIGIGLIMAASAAVTAAPFVISARATFATVNQQTVAIAERDGAIQPLVEYVQQPWALWGILVPGTLALIWLLRRSTLAIAPVLLAIVLGVVTFAIVDTIYPGQLFSVRLSPVLWFALLVALLLGIRGILKGRRLAQVSLLMLPLLIAGQIQANSMLIGGGYPDSIDRALIAQPNQLIVDIARESGIPLLARPAPQVVASAGIDLPALVVGSNWSLFSPLLSEANPQGLITNCEDLHEVFTQGFSQPIDVAIVPTSARPVFELTFTAATSQFHGTSTNAGPVERASFTFPELALCPERFIVTEVADASVLIIAPR